MLRRLLTYFSKYGYGMTQSWILICIVNDAQQYGTVSMNKSEKRTPPKPLYNVFCGFVKKLLSRRLEGLNEQAV